MDRVLQSKTNRRITKDTAMKWLFGAIDAAVLGFTFFLLYGIAADGVGRLNFSFFTNLQFASLKRRALNPLLSAQWL